MTTKIDEARRIHREVCGRTDGSHTEECARGLDRLIDGDTHPVRRLPVREDAEAPARYAPEAETTPDYLWTVGPFIPGLKVTCPEGDGFALFTYRNRPAPLPSGWAR